ncbi:unnamed protein product [Cyprideis torosa]|uniref:Uncharacterized protein n=1 Tax=Cyprideis torosa TaxID=163714 RepID=A0A7R8ZLM7_9CRUS|nr:unnamed protein product [Cyprideis torosa]CAG0882578.1 unnamed protein product [Cyprideis torosa]
MASAAVHDPPPTYEESLELRTIRSQGNSSCAATSTTELILGSPDLFTEEGEASVSNVQLTRPPPRRHVPDAATWEMLDTLSRKEWIRPCPVRVLLFHTSDVYKRVRDLNLISTSLDILENAPGNCDADNAIIMDRDGELWKGDLVLRSRRNEVEFVITNGDDPPLPSEFENITILTQYGQIVNNSVIMRPSLQAKFTSIMDRALRSQVREFFVIVSDDQWYYEGILTEFIHFVKASGLENYLAFKVFLLQAPSSNNSKLRDQEIKLVLTTASDLEGFPLDVPWFSLEGPQYPNLFTVEDVNDSDLRDKKSSAISDKAASFARSVGFFSPIEVFLE